MPITLLRITDFRNLATVELAPCAQGLNIIHGQNGSGKTSLLESIYYLGLGRSFRSSTSSRLIRYQSDKFSIFAQLLNASERLLTVGVERGSDGSSLWRMADKDLASIAELACFLPIRVINSQSHHLFEAGPVFRRKYLDWGLFYHSERFLPCWRQLERILKQRNTLLREKRPKKELDPWTDELIKFSLELDRLRRDYVQILTPLVLEVAQQLLPLSSLEINYHPGWSEDRDYPSVLSQSYAEEYRVGHTLFGPHRAELDIKIDTIPVRHFLSRGQQKLLICAMILAQGILQTTYANKGLIYLVDDLPAELDLPSRQRLISLLSAQGSQIFITAIESETMRQFINEQLDVTMKVFHVEHGNLRSDS